MDGWDRALSAASSPSYARARSVGVAGLGRVQEPQKESMHSILEYGGNSHCIAPEPVSSSIAPWVKPCVFLNCSVGKTLCLPQLLRG